MKAGHIKGLRLPRRTWAALKRDRILTIAQLADIAPRIERVVPGIGGKAARMIREQMKGLDLPETAPAAGEPVPVLLVEGTEQGNAPIQGMCRIETGDGRPVDPGSADAAAIVWRVICPRCGNCEIQLMEKVRPLEGA